MTGRAPAIQGFRPLYQQVKDLLVERLIGGYWRPGDLLPSEIQLAAELGVSQGTVRKALDEMTAENLLVPRPWRRTSRFSGVISSGALRTVPWLTPSSAAG